MLTWINLYFNRRMGVLLLLGFSSGLPLALTASTLQAWMASVGVNLTTIGIFSLVGLPYTLKFLWAPFLDRYFSPIFSGLGRRRGWMLLMQILLILTLVVMAVIDPVQSPLTLAILALLTAFFSATQDILVDAYRAELLDKPEVAAGAAIWMTGYRVAMIVSGAVALILADRVSWTQVYWIMALCMGIGVLGVFFAQEPKLKEIDLPKSLKSAVFEPFLDFFKRALAIEVLFFVILYKLDSVVSQAMKTPFFLELEFTKTEIGVISKGFGMVAALVGGLLGGGIVSKLGIKGSLIFFGVLQALSNFSYLVLAQYGKNLNVLKAVIGVDEICGGMGNAAFIAFLTGLCSRKFTATQYALLSSLSAVSRVVLASPTGWLVLQLGWTQYYWLSVFMALPALALLVFRFSKWET